MGTKVNPDQIIAAIENAGPKATYAQIATVLGVRPRTLRNYKARWKTVAVALEDLREDRHDFVESKLMDAIENGNIAAIIFYAKTQMKDRGYVERQELTGADGNDVTIRVIYGDDGTDG
jgi:hypothetical protein